MRATIRDVSREAGVSIKTVSRVLNNERYVGAETRAKVEAAVAALNFRPSLAARSLAGRRSYQVALVCDNPSPHYVFEMQSGIRDRCQTDGVRMIAQPYDRGSERLLADIEALVDTSHLDGLVLTPPVSDNAAVLDLLARRKVRIVRVSPGARPDAAPAVFIDNVRASAALMAHLLALGHRRIAHIAGPADYATSGQRLAGYRAALDAAGLTHDPALVADGAFTFASGATATERLLDLAEPPTAIFAASDDMAAAALSVAHRRGMAVPRRLSVAGFGDDSLAEYVWPPLTTVRQPVRAFGWNAADLLLAGDEADERRELPFELVVRGSTAALSR